MDGATSSFTATWGTTTHAFSCTNTRTPEFTELETRWNALLAELATAAAH